MRRREFVVGLAGSAAWPIAARAQQGERVRRIGVLTGRTENDSTQQALIAALRDGLAKLGWVEGRNLRITPMFYSLAGKWLELLKEAAPGVQRVAVMYKPQYSSDDPLSIMATAWTHLSRRTPAPPPSCRPDRHRS
jgi:hypothetical protein